VHALIGSNGAGKSTFARILCGLTPANNGEMQFNGQRYAPRSKREAEHAGIVMVLQELNVIGTLSVAENIFLNRLPRRAGFVRFADLHAQAREALARVGLATSTRLPPPTNSASDSSSSWKWPAPSPVTAAC